MQDVKVDRNKYIGGSDIPILMGISPFKKRFDLLLEKAELQKNEFEGNQYTEYGNIMEPKIRGYINSMYKKPFVEDKKIVEDVRCHVDGWNGKDTILEIKTTSQVYDSVDEYKVYLVQLLFYMHHYGVKKGKLAVYERPKDFNVEFNADLVSIYDIDIKDYKELLEEVLQAVDQFRIDLEKVKANPFITEEDLQPKELIELSKEVAIIENQLAAYKKLDEQYKEIKLKLYEAMEKGKVKKWTTINGIQITLVEAKPDTTKTVTELNVTKLQEENPELCKKYMEEKTTTKKGQSGYVKITLPKEDN